MAQTLHYKNENISRTEQFQTSNLDHRILWVILHSIDMHRESEPEGDKNSIFMFFSLQCKPVPHQHLSYFSYHSVQFQKWLCKSPAVLILSQAFREPRLGNYYAYTYAQSAMDATGAGRSRISGGGGGGQNKESHAKFLATPTSLPQTRQTYREVNGIQLFYLTNRFLHVAPFCSQLKVH